MMLAAAFLCLVTRVHDGDGPIWCKNGIRVRVAGVHAPDFENAEAAPRAELSKAEFVIRQDDRARDATAALRVTLGVFETS